jgi:hypothetical protein
MPNPLKALFFLRHYNDIDHVTPVVDKWLAAGHVADIIMMGARKSVDDYRIRYLSSLEGTRVWWIGEVVGRFRLFRMGLQKLLLNRYFRALFPAPLATSLDKVISKERRVRFWTGIAEIILDHSFGRATDRRDESGLVAFDWISGNSVFPVEFVESVVASAKKRGLGAISLPHGDSPHSSLLVRIDELDMQPRTKFSPARMFDRVVVPNELCARRFRPFLEDSQVAVLGSPRYCDEWLEKLAGLLPASPLKPDVEKFKIVVFLRKTDFSVFWDEVGRAIKMWAAFPQVEIMVKAHTRGGWRQPISRSAGLRKLDNVRFVAGEIHSSHLLEWADLIIDIATSVAFEAVKQGKPVLAADYLHAPNSTVGMYMPECVLLDRDDAYVKVHNLIQNGSSGFYSPENRQNFLQSVIDVPDKNVLPRFVQTMEELV